ncbi:UDP-arabinose 4-epimerase [Constrictibacter sp. MBR-5]|jgi:UDP-glucose-4-epimerase GalE|uniref:UDP-glucose 4-epimerase GalE n=1 Tax=Constrictibacter sp. MBR-5 TaxID=3156467 RepID=UPI0033977E0D
MRSGSVLIVGGAGYIGSHVAKAAAMSGYEPVVLDNLSAGHRWAVRWGPLVQADCRDEDALARTIRVHRPHTVVHLAGRTSVAESMQSPDRYYEENLCGSLALLRAMIESDCRNIVFSSTAAVYGEPLELPVAESHPLQPCNPYGETKLAVERAIAWHARAYGIRYAILRYFNAAGADPDGEIGEEHMPETHLVPLAILAALGRGDRLRIFGRHYPTADGTAIRDFVHVTDLAAAHVAGIRHLLAGGSDVSLNVGTGRGASIMDVLGAVRDVVGKPVPYETAEPRRGDPAILIAGGDLIRSRFAWVPQFSGLSEIVQSAAAWHSSRLAQVFTPL